MTPLAPAKETNLNHDQSKTDSVIFLILSAVPIIATVLFGAVDNTTWVLITLLWTTIALLWLKESWNSGVFRLSSEPLQLPLLGILLIGLIQLLPFGTIGNIDGAISAPISTTISLDPQATRIFVSRVCIYIGFFGACLVFINSERRVKNIALMIIIFGSAMAFFGILQRLANPEGIYGLRETPQAVPFGPFVNQHHFASFMQMTIGAAAGLLLGRSLARDKKTLLVIAIVIMGVAVLLTSSRGGLIGLIAVVCFALLLNGTKGSSDRGQNPPSRISSRVAMGSAVVGFSLVIIGIAFSVGGEDSVLRGIGMTLPGSDITTGRSYFWSVAWQMFLDHPVIGVGWDAFGVAFTRYDTENGLFRVEQAHNEYLQFLADGGLLGFLCIAAFIVLLFRQGLRNISRRVGMSREISIGALAGCFGIIVHSFVDFPLRTHSNGFFFLMLVALAVAPGRDRKNA